jgi:hypothetical protein
MSSSVIHKMTFVPCKLVTIQVGCLSALVYPKIGPGMPVFECVHAFQVVKSTLEPLPVNTCLILDAISTQLNCSAIINGLMYNWCSLIDAAWYNFCNLSIISYHNLAGDPINNTTVAGNLSLLLPMVNGAVGACRNQDDHYICASCTVDYRGLVFIPNPGPKMLPVGFYIKLPQLAVVLTNGNNVAYNPTTWQGLADLTSLTKSIGSHADT